MARANPFFQGCALEPVPLEEKPLSTYEALGRYACEEKHDGVFASLQISGSGPHDLRSRNGLVIGEKDPLVEPFRHLVLPDVLRGGVLVGEFEIATQASTDRVAVNGYRRMFVFDVAQLNGRPHGDTLEGRRWWLEELWPCLPPDVRKLLVLTEQWESGFWHHAQKIVADGGEGMVLKRLDSRYQAGRNNCPDWRKCKKHVEDDFVAMGVSIGEKTGVVTSLKVGKYIGGVLKQVMLAGLSKEMEALRAVGKLTDENVRGGVVVVRGFEQFRSGAIRSGGIVGLFRGDKDAVDCTWESRE